jgi:hypothetical protein
MWLRARAAAAMVDGDLRSGVNGAGKTSRHCESSWGGLSLARHICNATAPDVCPSERARYFPRYFGALGSASLENDEELLRWAMPDAVAVP